MDPLKEKENEITGSDFDSDGDSISPSDHEVVLRSGKCLSKTTNKSLIKSSKKNVGDDGDASSLSDTDTIPAGHSKSVDNTEVEKDKIPQKTTVTVPIDQLDQPVIEKLQLERVLDLAIMHENAELNRCHNDNNNNRGRPCKKVEVDTSSDVEETLNKMVEDKVNQRLASIEKKLQDKTKGKRQKTVSKKDLDESELDSSRDTELDTSAELSSDEEVTKKKRKPKSKKANKDFRTPSLDFPTWKKGDSWDDFADSYISNCEASPWDPENYGRYLFRFLKDEALTAYKSVKEKYGNKILADCDKLLKKIGKQVVRDSQIYRNKLNTYRLTMDTELYIAHEKMLDLAKLGYPNASMETRMAIVKDKYLTALPPKIKQLIRTHKFGKEDLTELANIAESLRLEEISNADFISDDAVTINVAGTYNKQNTTQGQKVQQSDQKVADSDVCYWCARKGHKKYQCKDMKAGKPKVYNGPEKPPRQRQHNGKGTNFRTEMYGKMDQITKFMEKMDKVIPHQGN